jgi:NAD(P)-dependent dehydrogenase (short-subunit alcohol dehydrogenase family)
MAQAKLKHPRDRGPSPPFPQQPIFPPGREREINPAPDHGELGYQASGKLTDRVALITGGDSGIGRAVALLYAQEGAKVVINALPDDADDAAKTIQLIKKLGGDAVSVLGDVGDSAFCKSLVEKAVAQFGSLDILVNNAAYQRSYEQFEEISLDEIQKTFQTNVFELHGAEALRQAQNPQARAQRVLGMLAGMDLCAQHAGGSRADGFGARQQLLVRQIDDRLMALGPMACEGGEARP